VSEHTHTHTHTHTLRHKSKEGADGFDDRLTVVRLDPVQLTQMAKHLETVYVSGWQSSSTASSSLEPGPDLAGT
jgi:isocitrate lyase